MEFFSPCASQQLWPEAYHIGPATASSDNAGISQWATWYGPIPGRIPSTGGSPSVLLPLLLLYLVSWVSVLVSITQVFILSFFITELRSITTFFLSFSLSLSFFHFPPVPISAHVPLFCLYDMLLDERIPTSVISISLVTCLAHQT